MPKAMVRSEYHANGSVSYEMFLESEHQYSLNVDTDSIYSDYFNSVEEAEEFIEEIKQS